MNQLESFKSGMLFNTKGMPGREGLGRWQDLVYEVAPMELDIQLIGGKKKDHSLFAAHASAQITGNVGIFSSTISHDCPLRATRNHEQISRARTEGIGLYLQDTGSGPEIRYRGKNGQRLASSEWILLNTSDNYQITFGAGKITGHMLFFPAGMLEGLCLNSDAFGIRMSANRPLNRLVASYIRTLAGTNQPIASAGTGEAMARNLVELIAIAANDKPDIRDSYHKGLASGILEQLTHYLDAHFQKPGLSPEDAAAAAGITSRHVHRILERADTTFSEQLFTRRLRHAHYLLTDTACRHTITDIAYDCGFSNPAHFCRKYREMYGRTPSETRNFQQS